MKNQVWDAQPRELSRSGHISTLTLYRIKVTKFSEWNILPSTDCSPYSPSKPESLHLVQAIFLGHLFSLHKLATDLTPPQAPGTSSSNTVPLRAIVSQEPAIFTQDITTVSPWSPLLSHSHSCVLNLNPQGNRIKMWVTLLSGWPHIQAQREELITKK